MKSFRATYLCRFCTATIDQMQSHEVAGRGLSVRTEGSHDHDLNVIKSRGRNRVSAVFKGIVFSTTGWSIFIPSLVFPADALHDLLEGIVPVELALCIRKMIRSKYFTLQYLNKRIASFPYQHTDNVDRPQRIPKTYAKKNTIGGNGHENATLLMDLKKIVELAGADWGGKVARELL